MTDSEVRANFPGTLAKDMLSLCLGEAIGEGSTRTVYRSTNPDYVYKFETSARRFQNIMEWETWDIIRLTKHKLWFVPCVDIADCGTILVQKYARPLEIHELPEDIPAYFADVKQSNWGMYQGHPCCLDYGNTFLIDKGVNNKMRKAEW